jgi:hypothetical protein
MKKTGISKRCMTAVFFLSGITANAQWSTTTAGGTATLNTQGSVTIGGNIVLKGDSYVTAATTNNYTAYSGGTNYTNGGSIVLRGSTSPINPFGMEFYTAGVSRMTIGTDGAVKASGNLSVGGNITLLGDSYVSAATSGNFTAFSGGTNYTNGGTMVLRGSTSPSNPFGVEFYTSGSQRMVIEADGGVRIGSISTPNPAGYKLYVDQGILTEKVKVAVAGSAQWADYVFKKDYELMPLNDVEKFVKTNNHLPGVPSAAEMVKEGNDLGKTDAKLLEKIEELTLYIISQQKEIELLKVKVNGSNGNKNNTN